MTAIEFSEKVNAGSPLLVDFYADWCEPCKMLDIILDEVGQNLTGKIIILKIDLDKSEELKKAYDIMSVPTLMLFMEGELRWRMAGFMLAGDLTRKIEEYIRTVE